MGPDDEERPGCESDDEREPEELDDDEHEAAMPPDGLAQAPVSSSVMSLI